MSIRDEAIEFGRKAKEAARSLAQLSTEEKNRALLRMAEGLEGQREFLLRENQKDLDLARKAELSTALLDRVALNPSRIESMAKGLREVASLPDPVREIVKMWRRPNGLQVGKMRIPLGVIATRPDLTLPLMLRLSASSQVTQSSYAGEVRPTFPTALLARYCKRPVPRLECPKGRFRSSNPKIGAWFTSCSN